jgi:hypothetical protein
MEGEVDRCSSIGVLARQIPEPVPFRPVHRTFAIISIATLPPFGRPATCTVARAGLGLLEGLGVTLNKKQIRNGRCLASFLNIS